MSDAPRAADTQAVDHGYDRILMLVTFVLIGVGLVMVYSASVVTAETRWGDSVYFLRKQLFAAGVGLAALVTTMYVHHAIFERISWPLLGVAVLLLMVVLLPGVSVAKGATRWINLGMARFQPSELVKLAYVAFLATWLIRCRDHLHEWRHTWGVPLAVTGVVVGLLMKQPDFGSSIICTGLMVMMIWLAGARQLHTGLLVVSVIPLGALAVALEPYRIKRLLAFLSPENDPLGVSYQINQALISFGSGEWTGVGLGASKQKLMYLPDAHTDFIFSIIGEELGLVGAFVVMTLFAVFVWRGWVIATRAATPFGTLLAFGITALIGFQAATNMAVVMALLPTKGLTLPFISYGGSSLVMTCAAVGVLLNISRCLPPPAWMHRRWLPAHESMPRRGHTAAHAGGR